MQVVLRANGITALRQGYYYRPSVYSNKEADLRISDTDVRGVLNGIVKQSEYKMWRIKRSGENREFLELGF